MCAIVIADLETLLRARRIGMSDEELISTLRTAAEVECNPALAVLLSMAADRIALKSKGE